MKTSLQLNDSVENFVALLDSSASNLALAGAMLVRLYTANPAILEEVQSAAPSIPQAFLSRLLRVGEHSLRPELMLNSCPAYKVLARLPFSSQESVLTRKHVDLVVDPESGDTLRVPLTKLMPAQVKQAFNESGIRSADEQSAWLRRTRKDAETRNITSQIPGAPYQVKRGEIVVLRPCVITKADLLRLLAEV